MLLYLKERTDSISLTCLTVHLVIRKFFQGQRHETTYCSGPQAAGQTAHSSWQLSTIRRHYWHFTWEPEKASAIWLLDISSFELVLKTCLIIDRFHPLWMCRDCHWRRAICEQWWGSVAKQAHIEMTCANILASTIRDCQLAANHRSSIIFHVGYYSLLPVAWWLGSPSMCEFVAKILFLIQLFGACYCT